MLARAIHMSHACLIVDKLPFTESFFTIDTGTDLYFADASNVIITFTITEGAYMRLFVVVAIQLLAGRATTQKPLMNRCVHTLAAASTSSSSAMTPWWRNPSGAS